LACGVSLWIVTVGVVCCLHGAFGQERGTLPTFAVDVEVSVVAMSVPASPASRCMMMQALSKYNAVTLFSAIS
jgi:hypothetical protein